MQQMSAWPQSELVEYEQVAQHSAEATYRLQYTKVYGVNWHLYSVQLADPGKSSGWLTTNIVIR